MQRFTIDTIRDTQQLFSLLQSLSLQLESSQREIATLRRNSEQSSSVSSPRRISQSDILTIRAALQANGIAPLNVQQLVGILSQSQRGYAVVADSAAGLPDPTTYEVGTLGAVISGTSVTFYTVVEGTPRAWLAQTVTGTAHDLLSTAHGDTLAAAVVRGDMIVGNATPKWARVAKGTANQVWRMDGSGNDPGWGSVADAALSANVALESATNVFVPDQQMQGEFSLYANLTTAGLGLPPVLGTYSATGQTAALPATTVYSAPTSGLYVLFFHLVITTAGTGGTIAVDVLTTDRFGSFNEGSVGGTAATLINGRTRFSYPVYAAGGSNIQIQTTFSGVTGSPAYAIDAAVIRLV